MNQIYITQEQRFVDARCLFELGIFQISFIQVIDDWYVKYKLFYMFLIKDVWYMVYFLSHVHINMLQAQIKQHAVASKNLVYLELKISGFYKSPFVRVFVDFFSFIVNPLHVKCIFNPSIKLKLVNYNRW